MEPASAAAAGPGSSHKALNKLRPFQDDAGLSISPSISYLLEFKTVLPASCCLEWLTDSIHRSNKTSNTSLSPHAWS
jgi:hypothetical protein